MGDPTESAIRIAAEKLGQYDLNVPAESFIQNPMPYTEHLQAKYQKVVTLDFTNDRKAMSTVVKGFYGIGNSILIKGAPERIIANCETYKNSEGHIDRFSATDKAAMIAHVQRFAKQGLRVLGLSLI